MGMADVYGQAQERLRTKAVRFIRTGKLEPEHREQLTALLTEYYRRGEELDTLRKAARNTNDKTES